MTHPERDIIDRVVREVLARLRDKEPVKATAPRPARAPRAVRSTRTVGELAISSRVVSMADIGDRLQGVRRLRVLPGAVVTPSVRDEIRRRNIAVVSGKPETASSDEDSGVLVMVLGSRYDPAPLESALASEGVAARVERADCLVAATDAIAETVATPGRVALVLSGHPAVALCLANRHRSVRAILGIDPVRVSSDAASVGANVLVLDPRSIGPFQLRKMALGFCRMQPNECPADLQERLT